MTLQPNTLPYGRWQSSGCHWHSRKPWVGDTSHLQPMGFAPGLFPSHYCLQPPGLLGLKAGKDAGFGTGITGMQ